MPKNIVVAHLGSGQGFHPENPVQQGCSSKMTLPMGKRHPRTPSSSHQEGFRLEHPKHSLHAHDVAFSHHSHDNPPGRCCIHTPCCLAPTLLCSLVAAPERQPRPERRALRAHQSHWKLLGTSPRHEECLAATAAPRPQAPKPTTLPPRATSTATASTADTFASAHARLGAYSSSMPTRT